MLMVKKKAGRKARPSLTIAVDGGSLSLDGKKNKGGVATIVYNLLSTIAIIDTRNKYQLYSFAPINKLLLHAFKKRAKNNVLQPSIGYKSVRLPVALRQHAADVFLGLSQSIPTNAPPAIGFIYDLAFLTYPDLYTNAQKLRTNTEEVILRSKHLITISESTKLDIMKTFSVAENRISVIYPGVSDIYRKKGLRYVGDLPYFLYVGQLKKMKNIPRLLIGFHLFLQQSAKPFRLVLVGSRADEDPEIAKTIDRYKLGNSVLIKGYLGVNELPKYYRGATAFISPALYEGFGLPIVEAMASGVPVVVGNTGSQPEVVDKAGLLVSPESPEQIAEVLLSLSENEKLRLHLSKKGREQAKRFTWKRFARDVLDHVYKVQKRNNDVPASDTSTSGVISRV